MFFRKLFKQIKRDDLKNEIIRLNHHIKILETERDEVSELNKFQKEILEKRVEELIYPLADQINIDSLVDEYKKDLFRSYRIHTYVKEALDLISDKTKLHYGKTIYPLLNNENLNKIFLKHSSDKASRHNYGSIYEHFIGNRKSLKVLEIGIGSVNNYKYAGGIPAGSLKAWREFLPESIVVGADIDEKSVEAAGAPSFVVDQTKSESIKNLKNELTVFGKFNLIIDDGFHDPHANLRTLLLLKDLLSEDGKYVIEDVHQSLIDLWLIIAEVIDLNIEIFDLSEFRPNIKDNILVVFSRS